MKIEVLKGDITQMVCDAIVNAANSSLLGGGGVDGAIHRAGGKSILDECIIIKQRQGGCKTGESVITKAGNLQCKFVIHTVGPVWNGGGKNEDLLLSNCYTNSLNLAVSNHIKTIAFPNISTGIYKFPKKKAAKIALDAIHRFEYKEKLDKVYCICFDEENYFLYKEMLEA